MLNQQRAKTKAGLLASLTYHAWRGDKGAGKYEDEPGFCKSAKLEEIQKHGYVLRPGRYVGAEAVEDDGVDFTEKMKELSATHFCIRPCNQGRNFFIFSPRLLAPGGEMQSSSQP